MEALCNAIIFSEAPHASDGLLPGAQGVGQGDQRLKATGGKPVDEAQELTGEWATVALGLVFTIEKTAERLHLVIKRFEGGIGFEEFMKPKFLGW